MDAQAIGLPDMTPAEAELLNLLRLREQIEAANAMTPGLEECFTDAMRLLEAARKSEEG